MEKLSVAGLFEKYRNAARKAVLLDYDGTLVNYTAVPEAERLSEYLSDILIKLFDPPQKEVFIITGRSVHDISKILDHLPVNIIAEHGAMVRENGIWKKTVSNDSSWKGKFIPILNQFSSRCPKTFTEEKNFSLTWHYRSAESAAGYALSRELLKQLSVLIRSLDLRLLDGNKVIEILTKETGKGLAVKKLLEQNSFDFVLSIGDDATDEEMFEFLYDQTNAFTIKVGDGDTFARYKLNSINDVVVLLKQLSA
jgi:trehalose 6-phosphate synthase/phosphatase